MRRVIVIGCPGAGKSAFFRRLRDLLGLPLYYLDQMWHKADGTHVTEAEFDRGLRDLTAGDRWIIDGNYMRTLAPRLEACGTVFLLDYPLEVCLAGAEARVGKRREDLPWVETSFDEEFKQWIMDFPQTQLPRVYALLERYRDRREVIVFKAREEAEAYLAGLEERVRRGL